MWIWRRDVRVQFVGSTRKLPKTPKVKAGVPMPKLKFSLWCGSAEAKTKIEFAS